MGGLFYDLLVEIFGYYQVQTVGVELGGEVVSTTATGLAAWDVQYIVHAVFIIIMMLIIYNIVKGVIDVWINGRRAKKILKN